MKKTVVPLYLQWKIGILGIQKNPLWLVVVSKYTTHKTGHRQNRHLKLGKNLRISIEISIMANPRKEPRQHRQPTQHRRRGPGFDPPSAAKAGGTRRVASATPLPPPPWAVDAPGQGKQQHRHRPLSRPQGPLHLRQPAALGVWGVRGSGRR